MIFLHWRLGHIIPKPIFVPLSEGAWSSVMVWGQVLDLVRECWITWRYRS